MYLGDIFGDTKVTANGYCLRLTDYILTKVLLFCIVQLTLIMQNFEKKFSGP